MSLLLCKMGITRLEGRSLLISPQLALWAWVSFASSYFHSFPRTVKGRIWKQRTVDFVKRLQSVLVPFVLSRLFHVCLMGQWEKNYQSLKLLQPQEELKLVFWPLFMCFDKYFFLTRHHKYSSIPGIPCLQTLWLSFLMTT